MGFSAPVSVTATISAAVRSSGVLRFAAPVVIDFGAVSSSDSAQCVVLTGSGDSDQIAAFRVEASDQAFGIGAMNPGFNPEKCSTRVPLQARSYGVNQDKADLFNWIKARFATRGSQSTSPASGLSFAPLVFRAHPQVNIRDPNGQYVVTVRLECLASALLDKTIPVESNRDDIIMSREVMLLSLKPPFAGINREFYNLDLKPHAWLARGKCPAILAHRAVVDLYSELAIENHSSGLRSLPSSRLESIDGIEIDVYLFRDAKTGKAVPIVSHDNDLDRLVSIKIKVTDLRGSDELDAVRRLTNCELFEPVDAYFKELRAKPRLMVDLDLKPESPLDNPWPGYAEDLGRVLSQKVREYGIEDRVVATGFDVRKIQHFNDNLPRRAKKIRVGLGVHKSALSSLYNSLIRGLGLNPLETVRILHFEKVTKEIVDDAHASGQAVGVYTIYDKNEPLDERNSPSYQPELIDRLLSWGVDWLETDHPSRLRQALAKRGCSKDYQRDKEDLLKRWRQKDPATAAKVHKEAEDWYAYLRKTYLAQLERDAKGGASGSIKFDGVDYDMDKCNA